MNQMHTGQSRPELQQSTRGLRFLIVLSFTLSATLANAKLDASFDLPLPCEKASSGDTFGGTDQQRCTIGLRDCGEVANGVIADLNANYKFKLEQFAKGEDPLLNSDEVGKVPPPCDPLNLGIFTDDPSCKTAKKATITSSGGVFGGPGQNPPGSFENRFKWGLFVNAFTCAQNDVNKKIKEEFKINPSTACVSAAVDARNLFVNQKNVAEAKTKTILPSLGKEVTSFCHQKGNEKRNGQKVAQLCSKGAEITDNGNYSETVRDALQNACQLQAAEVATTSAFAHIAECTILAEAYETHEQNVSKPGSAFESFLNNNLLKKCNSVAKKAAKKCRLCSSSKRKKKALSAYASCYNGGIYVVFRDFAKQTYASCGKSLQINSDSPLPPLFLTSAPGAVPDATGGRDPGSSLDPTDGGIISVDPGTSGTSGGIAP